MQSENTRLNNAIWMIAGVSLLCSTVCLDQAERIRRKQCKVDIRANGERGSMNFKARDSEDRGVPRIGREEGRLAAALA